MLTISELERIGVPYKAVIESQEYGDYSKVIDGDNIIVLPHQNEGLTATRNWIWDYAQNELKTPYFWTLDDNIRGFYRLHKNMKYTVNSGVPFRVIEDFALRYKNLYISGMAYEKFAPRKKRHHPYGLNSRVYSNMLIKTDIPYRNKLFYNDDTDLCLRVLKDGACTIQFYAFLAEKVTTMKTKGGMTDYYEKTDNRLQFAQELQRAHPDVVKVTRKFGRWHHQVDYRPFKKNKLVRDYNVKIKKGVNNYGMELVKVAPAKASQYLQ